MKWDSVNIWFLIKVKDLAIKSYFAGVERAKRLNRMLFPAIKEESTTQS